QGTATEGDDAVMLFIHGSGRTDIRANDSYIDLRSRFAALGIACVLWDKPGCGRSRGQYDANQAAPDTPAWEPEIFNFQHRQLPAGQRDAARVRGSDQDQFVDDAGMLVDELGSHLRSLRVPHFYFGTVTNPAHFTPIAKEHHEILSFLYSFFPRFELLWTDLGPNDIPR